MFRISRLALAFAAVLVIVGPSPATAGYVDKVLSDSDLIAYYRLNETSGTTAVDSSNHAYDGTYYGSIPGENMAGPRASDGFDGLDATNTAPSFDDDSISLPGSPFDLEAITLSCFFKNSDTNKNHRLYSSATGSAHPLAVVLGGTPNETVVNSLDVGVRSGLAAYGSFSNDPLLTDDDWHHLIVVRHNDATSVAKIKVDVYIDGVLNLTGDFSEGHTITGDLTRIGNREEGVNNYNLDWVGGIDEMAFFARAFNRKNALELYYASIGEDVVIYAGDTDCNGSVDSSDAATLAANWLSQTSVSWEQGDFNDDGIVNDIDATMMAANWGKTSSLPSATTSVPEPASWMLLIAACTAILFMRKGRCLSRV